MPSESSSSETSDRLSHWLLDEVRRQLEASELSPGKGSLLLAVSGGVDSMAMLELLHRSGYAGGVAHFDHGLRGSEGEKDLGSVQREAERRGLPFYPIRLEPPPKNPERGIQNWGRSERYRWLYHIMEQGAFHGIATAHHADDRLETVLMGMLRGSGFRGVMGVPTEKEKVIRPLNRIWKEQIRSFARSEKLPYREDPSNKSERYLRNRIRQHLLPSLHDAFPEQEKALLRSLELLEASGTFLQEMGDRERERILRYEREKDAYWIPKAELRASKAPRVLFFELLRPFRIPHDQAEALFDKMDAAPGARVRGRDRTLLRDRDHFIIVPNEPSSDRSDEGWSIPSIKERGGAPLMIDIEEGRSPTLPRSGHEAILDAAALRFPLKLRKNEQGDRFRPFGMKEGSKTVKEHLTDRKWAAHEKDQALVLCDAEGKILWVVGSTIDERFRIGPKTERLIRFRYDPTE